MEPHQTPLELGLRLSARFPGQTDAIEVAVSAYVESVYRREKAPSVGAAQRLKLAGPTSNVC